MDIGVDATAAAAATTTAFTNIIISVNHNYFHHRLASLVRSLFLSYSPFLTRGNVAVNGVGSSQYSNSYIIIITTIITIIIVMAVMVMAAAVVFVTGGNGFAVNVIVSVWKYFRVSCASFRELIAEY